jgi:hypothetical protein
MIPKWMYKQCDWSEGSLLGNCIHDPIACSRVLEALCIIAV